MDHEGCSSAGMSAPTTFTFAFNESNFSDRVLRIEVVAVPDKLDGDIRSARQKKRRRGDRSTEAGVLKAFSSFFFWGAVCGVCQELQLFGLKQLIYLLCAHHMLITCEEYQYYLTVLGRHLP